MGKTPPSLVAAMLIVSAAPAFPQEPGKGPGKGPGMPAPQVSYTEAREHALRQTLTFPGTVEAQTATTLASTVAGLVTEFPAKEGTRVVRGQLIAKLRSTPVELTLVSQQASLKEAEARLKLAQSTLNRVRELHAAGVASQQQLDDAQSEANAWIGRTDALKADIARLQDELERMNVRAPLAGIVVKERTEVGQWMSIGGAVVDLLAIDQMEIRLELPERHFAGVRVGATATATFESLPGYRVSGKIIAVIPQADAQARTFPVKVLVSNENGRLGAGMLAQVSFTAGEVYRATIVPKDAVLTRGTRHTVYRLDGESKVEEVDVETGAGAGEWIEVRGKLHAGDKVITRGNERLMPGMQVHAQPLSYSKPAS
jgi:RND family efflux transporter MFP subunit